MKSTSRQVLAAAAMLLAASGVQAAAVPFTASLALQIATLAPIAIPGSGTAIVNGSAGGTHVHSLALAGSTFATAGLYEYAFTPSVFPIASVQLTAHSGPGSFSEPTTIALLASGVGLLGFIGRARRG